MIILMFSAAFVGFVHSLAPGHWFPVVLMAKMRKWPVRKALMGAAVTAFGHILLSILLGLLSILIGSQLSANHENLIERYTGAALGIFGLIYAGFAFFRHSSCQGHIHHGPVPSQEKKTPFFFLFSLGFSPCVAAVPVFAAAATEGSFSMILSFISFSLGVLAALLGSTLCASLGLLKLDHPLFEHYGDVITGLGVALMGLLLYFVPMGL